MVLWTASEACAVTLEEALSSLLADHPQIKAATKQVATARAGIAKAGAGFYPKVNVLGTTGPERIDSPTTRSSQEGGKDFSRTKQVGSLTVTQNLFNGFATSSATKQAEWSKQSSQAKLEDTMQQTLMEGVKAYVDVLRQLQLVELAIQNEETIQIQLNLEDERVQKGSGIAVDVLQAKSRLQLSKERRVRFEGALEDAFTKYTQVFNVAPEIDKLAEPMPSADLIPDSLEAAINIGLSENPQLQQSDRQVALAREKKASAGFDLYPNVDLVGKMGFENDNAGVVGTRRDMSVVLQANWDLFTGFTSRANVAQASFDYAASRDTYDFTIRKTVEAVRLAWQKVKTARERLALLENAVNIASEVFESRKKLRTAGKETVINVLDAETEISNARINFASASFDEREAVYNLLLAMGRLTLPELEVSAEGAGDTSLGDTLR
jgi:adhesin transport system outer membrane protein